MWITKVIVINLFLVSAPHPRHLPPRPIGHDREGAEAAEDAGYGCEGADGSDRER